MNEVVTAALQPYPLLFSLPHNQPLALLVVEIELRDQRGRAHIVTPQKSAC